MKKAVAILILFFTLSLSTIHAQTWTEWLALKWTAFTCMLSNWFNKPCKNISSIEESAVTQPLLTEIEKKEVQNTQKDGTLLPQSKSTIPLESTALEEEVVGGDIKPTPTIPPLSLTESEIKNAEEEAALISLRKYIHFPVPTSINTDQEINTHKDLILKKIKTIEMLIDQKNLSVNNKNIVLQELYNKAIDLLQEYVKYAKDSLLKQEIQDDITTIHAKIPE